MKMRGGIRMMEGIRVSVKLEILRIFLQNRDRTLSGEQLARQLSVSRAAVWKAVQALREDGYPIAAVTKKGYRLGGGADVLSEEGIRAHLSARWKHIPVLVLESVDSTNSQALIQAAQGAAHGSVIAADAQTAGRGRKGRPFFSPARTGLYLSVLLRPQTELSAALTTTAAAAVAACQAIEALTDARPQIKWVNDLYLGGKKAGGILTEAVSDVESGMAESIVVGTGLNCTTRAEDFPPELRGTAAGLSAKELPRCRLAAEMVSRLLDWQEAPADPRLIEEYRRRSLLTGREILYERGGRRFRGVVQDIDEAWRLVVRGEEGGTIPLSCGEVRLLNAF